MIAIPLFAYAIVVVIAFVVIVTLLAIVYRGTRTENKPTPGTRPRAPVDDDEDTAVVPARGGRKARGPLRARGRLNRRPIREEESSSDDEQADAAILQELEKEAKAPMTTKAGKKVGAKKQRKLEAKEAKKQEREAFLERKARQKEEEEAALEDSRKRKEKEEEERKKQELEEKLWKEEREKKAKEELDKWRDFIEVESSGSLQTELEEKRKRLEKFADHIKAEKVVMLEDLAVQFGLRTQEVISEIESLESQGKLTGVIDERGKFIYITPEEMAAVARFIKLRGRVSIDEIAAESNKLVNLNPKKSDAATNS